MISSPLLLSIDETAAALGIGRSLLLQKVYAGEIESIRIGRRRLISADALSGYIARFQAEQGEAESGND